MAVFETIIPYGVLLAQLLLVVIGIIWFEDLRIRHWIAAHARTLSLGVVSIATLGSLYYSNVLMYVPCDLCWYQRIFIFSMVPLFAVSTFLKKAKDIFIYGIVSAAIGFSIATYHYITQFFGIATSCGVGEAVGSCTGKYVFHFGYMTIPVMAMTTCALVIVFCVLGLKNKK